MFDWPNAQHVYLSPHLDDVVLSCGGTVFQQAQAGETIAVVTVFAGSLPLGRLSDFAGELHERWQNEIPNINFEDPPSIRRQEDSRAFRRLSKKIQTIHLPYPDCIYRANDRGEMLYTSLDQIFGDVSDQDPVLNALKAIGPPPPDASIYAPLGVGHHVDHQIVNNWVRDWGLSPTRAHYYEDYPYSEDEATVTALVADHSGWERTTQPLTESALVAKTEAVMCYETQISTFWMSVEAMQVALFKQANQSGGECYWQVDS